MRELQIVELLLASCIQRVISGSVHFPPRAVLRPLQLLYSVNKTHFLILQVGDLVKHQGKTLNGTVNRRFDDIESTILDNQTGALTNLTTKIETEISQVWRQIGIMYQQLTASATALDRLQQQTDAYVNGSVKTMDSMEGKVRFF